MVILNKEELAKYLNVEAKTVNYLLYQKLLPKIRIGREYRFPKEEIDRWLEHRKEVPKAFCFRKF